jgi:hypothetical protein
MASAALEYALNNGMSEDQYYQNIFDAVVVALESGTSTADMRAEMDKYGVSPEDVARATGVSAADVTAQYEAALPAVLAPPVVETPVVTAPVVEAPTGLLGSTVSSTPTTTTTTTTPTAIDYGDTGGGTVTAAPVVPAGSSAGLSYALNSGMGATQYYQNIFDFYKANANKSDAVLRAEMDKYGISPQDLATATGVSVGSVLTRYNSASTQTNAAATAAATKAAADKAAADKAAADAAAIAASNATAAQKAAAAKAAADAKATADAAAARAAATAAANAKTVADAKAAADAAAANAAALAKANASAAAQAAAAKAAADAKAAYEAAMAQARAEAARQAAEAAAARAAAEAAARAAAAKAAGQTTQPTGQSAALSYALKSGLTADQYYKNIFDFYKNNSGLSDFALRSEMDRLGVTPADVARATGVTLESVMARYNSTQAGTPDSLAAQQKAQADIAAFYAAQQRLNQTPGNAFLNAPMTLGQKFGNYESIPIGAQYNPAVTPGGASPYSQVMGQMTPFQNPYASFVPGTPLGGYNPNLYSQIATTNADVAATKAAADAAAANNALMYGAAGGADGGGIGVGEGPGGNSGGGEGNGATAGEAGAGYAMGGMVRSLLGPDPQGPDDGMAALDRGEYVIKRSSVNKYGRGLLDMINEGKVPAKKIRSLLD